MPGKRPAVLDASLVFTLSSAGILERSLISSRYEWHVTPLVRGEIVRRETRDVVDRAITSGRLRVAEIGVTDPVQLDAWVEWEQVVDIAEADAIALALARGWVVGLEDRQAQRALDRRIGAGRWINAANLLLDAVADDAMPLPEANAMFITLDSYPGYRKRGIERLTDL
jgi:predicted nucleic acid-binding protein